MNDRGPSTLILACGALARELRDVARLDQLDNVTIDCLPASLHNRPAQIPDALRAKLAQVQDRYERVLIGYADCGTAGQIDAICDEHGLERLPGAHCYQFYAGSDRFNAMHDNDPTAFYLTDFLVKHFDRLVMDGLGITEHPELRDAYFGNYTKLIYLAQSQSDKLQQRAQDAAAKLGLTYEYLHTGYGQLAESIVHFAGRGRVTA